MASSTASQGGYPRRRRNVGRQPLQRTNTLFGAIKNIVTAPLSWFATTDDFEDTKDGMGKRRRLAAVPTEIDLGEDERPSRTKRMRVDSPPRESQQLGYLDPPVSAFPQPIGRSVSAGNIIHPFTSAGDNGNNVRSTLTPFRNLSLSRTMSVDPLPRPQSADNAASQGRSLVNVHETDASMESVHSFTSFPTVVPAFPRSSLSVPRDISMSLRPTFRMRTSLTPQPPQIKREKSEPPPLQTLMANPTFVRPPPPIAEETPSAANESTATLGTLVDSARKARSPSTHGSLLFANKNQPESSTAGMTPAEKALHELEIYKTPLLPTRLRSGNLQSSITGVPDLFKPRRHSKLVLMKDEQGPGDRKLGRKEVSSPDKNVTKPYAGEGGMKRMLAKRKLELNDDEMVEEGSGKKEEKELEHKEEASWEQKEERIPDLPPANIPPANKQDWYSLASGPSVNAGGSSLRVGRVKTSRNHISRPAARPRSKFSAAFDDDDGDDAMGDEGEKEKQMLEEAAKKAPTFNIPAGFSFAQDVKSIEHDNSNAKEPPMKSLPFSFSPAPAALKPASAETLLSQATSSTPPPAKPLPFSFGPTPTATPEQPNFFGLPPSQPSSAPSTTTESVPNFFAKSDAFNKPLEIQAQPLTFGAPTSEPPKVEASAPVTIPSFSFSPPPSIDKSSSTTSAAPSLFDSTTPTAPVKDNANPLWDGEKKVNEGSIFKDLAKDKVEPAPFSFFGAASQKEEPVTSAAADIKETTAPTSVFGNGAKSFPSSVPFSFGSNDSGNTAANKPPQLTIETSVSSGSSLFGNKPASEANQATTSLFGGPPSMTGFGSANKGSLFGGMGTNKTATPSLSGPSSEAGRPTSANPPAATAPAATPFTFGQPSTSAASEAPKPAAPSSLFSFGQASSESKPASPAPFAFSSSSNDAKPTPAPFSFGSSNRDTKASSPAPFAFGGTPSDTPTTDKPSSTPFSFGAPASPAPQTSSLFSFGTGTAAAAKPSAPERLTTPPKNGDQEFKMEESPTREVHQINDNNKPSFGGGFSFGNNPPSGSLLFGGPSSATSTTSPFTFGGGSTPSPNPFAPQQIKESKSEEPTPFGFGQPSTSSTGTGFSFGQTQSSEPPRPSTTGSFNFGGSSSTPTTTTTSGFNFGASPTTNPFGQPASGSAPSSPSIFQPSGFNFGASSTNAPFGFGSQPASPAGSNNALPSATTPVTFGGSNTGFGSSAPSSPFSAPAQIAPSTSSGGTLFTIGSAPPPAATNAQGRTIRKLPNRTRGKR